MERHTQQDISEYWMQIPLQYKTKLARLRTWTHLKACIDQSIIWIRGLSINDVASSTVRAIPFKQFYHVKENTLFKVDGHLPEYRLKISWVWTSIEQILPLELPQQNFNFFEFTNTISIRLKPSTNEKKAVAQRIDWITFENYINDAPAVRLKHLKWLIVDQSVFLAGEPILALPGKTYWTANDFLIPTGFDFEFPIAISSYKKLLNPESNVFICYNEDGSFFRINKQDFMDLSISSYRKTIQL